MKPIISILLYVFLFHLFITCQESNKDLRKKHRKDREKYLITEGGVNFLYFQDQAVSTPIYKGILPQVGLEYLEHGEPFRYSINGSFAYGSVLSQTDNFQYIGTSYLSKFNFNFLWHINKADIKEFKLYIGGHLNTIYNYNFNPSFSNNSVFYDGLMSFGPSLYSEYTLRWKTKKKQRKRLLKFSGQIDLPILHLYMRPDFIVVEDFTDGKERISGFNSPRFGSFDKVFKLNTQLNLSYFLKNGNAIRFTYNWIGYSIDEGFNRLGHKEHQLLFGYLFRFNAPKND